MLIEFGMGPGCFALKAILSRFKAQSQKTKARKGGIVAGKALHGPL